MRDEIIFIHFFREKQMILSSLRTFHGTVEQNHPRSACIYMFILATRLNAVHEIYLNTILKRLIEIE